MKAFGLFIALGWVLGSAWPEASGSAATPVARPALSRETAGAILSLSPTGRLRSDSLMIRVNPALLGAKGLTVVTRAADGAAAATNVLRPADGLVELAIRTNKQYVVFPAAASRKSELTAGRHLFPGTLVVGGPSTQTRSGHLFLEPRTSPLPWSSEEKAYASDLVVGLDLTNQASSLPLKPPVTIQFFASHARVEPELVTIDQSGAAGYREVRLTCRQYETDSRVTARSDLGELSQGVQVEQLGFLALLEIIFPVTFLCAALLGGGLGGFLRGFRQEKASRARVRRRMVEGCIVGVLVVGALSVGLSVGNLSQAVVGREAGAFVVAALAGYAGTALLDKLTQTLFRTKTAPQPSAEQAANTDKRPPPAP